MSDSSERSTSQITRFSMAFRIFSAWFVTGFLAGSGLLYVLNPMAGLALLIVVMSLIMAFLLPFIHMGLRGLQENPGKMNLRRAIPILLTIWIAIAFLITITGIFNFT